MIATLASDADLNTVKSATNRNNRDLASQNHRQQFNVLSKTWGLLFNNTKIIVPSELRTELLDRLHYGHQR